MFATPLRKFVLGLVLLLTFGILLNLPSFDTTQVNAASSLQIEWVDLGQQAWYPGYSGISEGQSVVLNEKLYVFGGYEQCCFPIRSAYVFDSIANGWTQLHDLPQGTTHTGIASDGVNIYLAGGYVEYPAEHSRTVGSEKFWRYNVPANTYTALPNLPMKASTGQLVYLDGVLHYIGGTPPGEPGLDVDNLPDLPTHYVFDLQAYAKDPNTTWTDITSIAPLPNPRQHAGAVVLNGYIYYVGGQQYHNNSLVPQKDVHRYDPKTQTWAKMADMPEARNHMSNTIIVYDGRIIVMGGQLNHQVPKSEVFAYDPVSNSWSALTALPIQQFSGVGGVINGEFYYGTGDKGYSNDERRRMRKGIPLLVDAPATTQVPPTAPTMVPPSAAAVDLLVNGSFEVDSNQDRQPDSWTLKHSTGDSLKCTQAGKAPLARNGRCVYQFKGGGDGIAPENAKLQQSVNVANFDLQSTDRFTLSAFTESTSPHASGQIKVVVKYADGAAKSKTSVDLSQTAGDELRSNTLTLTSGNIAKIKVQIIHTSPQGKITVDAVRLLWESGADSELLALP
jgi:hypothetical protein